MKCNSVELGNNVKTHIENFPNKGRGLIANSLIHKGELIESAPALLLSAKDREVIKKTAAISHCFAKPDGYAKNNPCKGYIVFGLASLCNHSDKPNSYVKWTKTETGIWANLISHCSIKASEEITLYYTDINEYYLSGLIKKK